MVRSPSHLAPVADPTLSVGLAGDGASPCAHGLNEKTPIVPHEGADIYLFHENLKVIRSDVYFLVGASCTNLRLASVCFLHGLLT
jgi:hypothetical protein